MAGLFKTIRTVLTGSGLETSPYEVLRTEEGYEERLYPAQKWVTTKAQHMSIDSANSAMFWKLFSYISGQNDKQVKIPMTVPVTVLVEPGQGPACESTFTMAFYIPSQFQENPPLPTNKDVLIEERPTFRAFCRAFNGPTETVELIEEAMTLGGLIQSRKETGIDCDSYLTAHYYSHNEQPREEVWFVKGD